MGCYVLIDRKFVITGRETLYIYGEIVKERVLYNIPLNLNVFFSRFISEFTLESKSKVKFRLILFLMAI